MRGLSQRSSLASSLFTGVVGWGGGIAVTGLLVGDVGETGALIALVAVLVAIQVGLLRGLMAPLGLGDGIVKATVAGIVTGAPLAGLLMAVFPEFRVHAWVWLPAFVVMGAAVGFYLGYFHADDRRIEAEQGVPEGQGDYGRDGTWWEPFPAGGVVFLLFFGPMSLSLGFHAFFTGATIGVLAAATSHFVIANWEDSRPAFAVALVLGATLGLGGGWLLGPFEADMWSHPLLLGTAAGLTTFLGTLVRGRHLAAVERLVEQGEAAGAGES